MKLLGSVFCVWVVLSFVMTPISYSSDGQVTIKRDNYGVGHVYADTVYGLYYGYGYAVAQDRLFQMEMAKRSTQGKVAEVLGEEYVEFDKQIRGNYNPISIQRQLDALSENDADIFRGYAAGMNAWIEEVKKTTDRLMPKEFIDFGFQPEFWSAFDVAMIFVGSMANRFGDFNTELANVEIYNALVKMHDEKTALAIFEQLIPINIEDAPTTIPKGEWNPPAASMRHTAKLNNTAFLRSRTNSANDINESSPSNFNTNALYGISGASNCVVIGKKKAEGAKAILMNGPQFGWYLPGYVYSIGLHGAGFDLVGNTPFAYPIILFGHNRDIAWGSTWGAGDMVDIYVEELNSDNPHVYRYKGNWLPMEERTEIIKVKDGQSVEFTVYRTIHGPIVKLDPKNNVAYTKKRTWDGIELESLLGWIHSTRAKNFDEWLPQAKRMALNINWYYADKDGNIGYAFTGKYPRRSEKHDNRLPQSGAGHMEWQELLPFDYTPRVFNPKQGFLANWNNKPAVSVNNPDEFWYSWGLGDRVDIFINLLEKQEKWTADQVWDLIEISSFADINASYFMPIIEKAGQASSDEKLKSATAILLQWNQSSRDKNDDGKYDQPATAIFRTFLPEMIKLTLADDLGDAFNFFAAAGYPTPKKHAGSGSNLQIGVKAIIESLHKPDRQKYDFFNGQKPETVVTNALSIAIETLEKDQGADMSKWRLPTPNRPFPPKNFLGIPQTSQDASLSIRIEQNRGTENDMIVFTDDGIISWEVAPPGQSGFIAPDGTKSPHYDDQLKMYETFGKKRMWLTEEDVEKNKKSEVVLKY